MPILFSCQELAPGMTLAEPIVSEGRVMLQSGRSLSEEDIDILTRRYPNLSVRVGDPLLDQDFEFEDDHAERRIASETRQRIAHELTLVRDRYKEQAPIGGVVCERVSRVIDSVIDHLTANPRTVALISHSLKPANFLGTHTGNVFYLSLLLAWTSLDYVITERRRQTKASRLRENVAMDLTPLGLGAFFLDVALLRAPGLFTKPGPLGETGRRMLENHPDEGADLLSDNLPAAAKMIVRTHHETVDGSGYPQGLPVDKQHVFTRIVRIADAYDAATSRGVFKEARSPVRVLYDMLAGPDRHYYDTRLMRSFVRLIQPFPIGSKVQLEDGRVAVITQYNRTNPFRPTIVISFDDQGRPLSRDNVEGPVTAGDRPELRMRTYEGEDLSFLYEPAPETDAPPPRRRPFTTLLDALYP